MASHKSILRLKRRLRNLLIAAELDGLGQQEIIHKCRTYNSTRNPNGIKGDDIRDVLNNWKARGLVQRFKVQKGHAKKPTIVWRATVEIKKEQI